MTIYQHPLAYLLGLEGLALLRAWGGDFDERFTRERLTEVRRLLDEPALADHPGIEVGQGTALDGYRQWAASYDEPNGLFDFDEPFVDGVLDRLAPGDALDAACGTGRLAVRLADRGHRVLGVDESAEMLAVARERVPNADFVPGALDRLPASDRSRDVVVCGLALSHLRDLGPAFAEFARVLRPGGHLIISDTHQELIFRGSVVKSLGPRGEPGLVPTYRHSTVDFLQAALAQRLVLLACEEPGAARTPPSEPATESVEKSSPTGLSEADLGPWELWPWTLMGLAPTANGAASQIPSVINFHFRLDLG